MRLEIDNMHELEEYLQHHGVKGMKWGVRRVRDKLGSLRRERQWKKVIGELDNLSTDQINVLAKRVGLENDLKRLTKNKAVSKPADREDYIKRASLSDADLAMKVVRLRAKENLTKKISDASKEQRELGEKIVNIGGTVAVKYATTKSLTPKDVFDAVAKPINIKDKGVKALVETILKNSSK